MSASTENGYVNSTQQQKFARCVEASMQIQEIEEFKEWVRCYVRPLINHEALVCVHGLIYAVGISLDFIISIDCPKEHLEAIRNASGHMDTPLARRWIEQQSPLFFDEKLHANGMPEHWLHHFRRHNLKNAAVDGMLDKEQCIATYFSFHRLPTMDETLLTQTFKLLTPVLHQTYVRVVRHYKQRHAPISYYFSSLTEREYEIANWISQGKSNNDIANLLTVTESTIKNHISHIFQKTGCNNRALLAVAMMQQEQNRFGMGMKVM